MSLSDEERRSLEELEQDLAATDPDLAHELMSGRLRGAKALPAIPATSLLPSGGGPFSPPLCRRVCALLFTRRIRDLFTRDSRPDSRLPGQWLDGRIGKIMKSEHGKQRPCR